MHESEFDQAIRGGARGVPRRGLLGIAAGLLASSAVGPDAEGKRRRRKKRCKRGTSKCSKTCVNLQTDSANCGACSAACTGGRSCSGGACTCPANQSFVDGACIPRFGCTLELDTCEFGKKLCPIFTNESDARCYVSAAGEPFCGTNLTCEALAPGATCPPVGSQQRTFIPCALCTEPEQTGGCIRPIARVRTQVGDPRLSSREARWPMLFLTVSSGA